MVEINTGSPREPSGRVKEVFIVRQATGRRNCLSTGFAEGVRIPRPVDKASARVDDAWCGERRRSRWGRTRTGVPCFSFQEVGVMSVWFILGAVLSLAPEAPPGSDELAPPIRLTAGGKAINVDIGHAAPFWGDIDGS